MSSIVRWPASVLLLALVPALVGCKAAHGAPTRFTHEDFLPGMPPVPDAKDIYADTRPGMLSPAVRDFPPRIYVPNSMSDTVDVIDPRTRQIVEHFAVGKNPQHVTPSYDLKTLWVLNDLGDSLTAIDPLTGARGRTVKVMDPYNMYYTPDGRYAIVVAERLKRLDFRDAQTMALVHSVAVPCRGVDHMDFSESGRYLIASCEFSGQMIKVDVAEQKLVGVLDLPMEHVRPKPAENAPPRMRAHHRVYPGLTMAEIHDSIMTGGPMPQDVKVSPDGRIFYVADMASDGVHMIDGDRFQYLGFIPTGRGAHGLYTSRDSRYLYVSNREEGTVSLIALDKRKVAKVWTIPGGGSPDMGGVSADGKVLWLTGRYDREVYALDTDDGTLLARIKVGKEPHGLCVYPQPGRYSLGHTGVLR
jgi:YVTN family beta-propeller protein